MLAADNRVRTVIDLFGSGLATRYDEGEVKAIVRTVFQQRLGWDVAQLQLRGTDLLSESELLQVCVPLKRLMAGVPLQYALGSVVFHGLDLRVAPSVLIPRPETEELVQRIVDAGGDPHRLVDVGTGSGCIALALKKAFPNAEVFGIDVSEEALEQARANGARTGLDVNWSLADVLDDDMDLPGDLDIVVSNPPYVPRSEIDSLSEHVRGHEPHLALFVEDDDPLIFYRVIATKALKALAPDGRLYFEGHHRTARSVGRMLEEMGYDAVQVLKDMDGQDRFIEPGSNVTSRCLQIGIPNEG